MYTARFKRVLSIVALHRQNAHGLKLACAWPAVRALAYIAADGGVPDLPGSFT